MFDFLKKKYDELLNPINQGLSQIGKNVSQAGTNAVHSFQQLPNVIGQDLGLIGNQIRPMFQSPKYAEQLPKMLGTGLQQATNQTYGKNALSDTLNNFVVPGIENVAGAVTAPFTNKKPLQKVGDIAKGVGSLMSPGSAIMGGVFNAGLNTAGNLKDGKPLNTNLNDSIRQGYDFGAMLGPIGKIASKTPGLNLTQKYSAMLAPEGSMASRLLGNVGKGAAEQFLTGTGYGLLEGQNPVEALGTGASFAPYGALHAFEGEQLKKTNINPNESPRMAPKDIADTAAAIERLATREDAAYYGTQRVKDQKFVRQMAEDYINKKFASQKDFQTVVQEMANRVRIDQGMPEINLPGGMNLVEQQGPKTKVKTQAQIKAEQAGFTKVGDVLKETPQDYNQPTKKYTQIGSYTNTRSDQIAPKYRKVDPFEAEMDAQVGKGIKMKPKRKPMTLTQGDVPQYSQGDSNFEGGRAQMNAEENKGRFNDLFAKWVGKRDAANTTGTLLGSKFKDIQPEKFRSFAKKIETGQETKYSTEVRNQLDKVYTDAQQNGIEMGYRENYLPHVWDKGETQVAEQYKIFKRREGFQNDRVLPTYEEGIQMGLKPKYKTVGELLADYGTKVDRLKANLEFFKQLKDEGFIVDASVGTRQPGFTALDGPGFPRSVSKGIDGQTIYGNYYAPTEFAQKINKIFSPDPGNPILGKTRKVSSVIQDVTLSGGIPGTPLNAFTAAQVQKEMLAGRLRSPIAAFIRSISPGKSLEYFQKNAGQIKKMQENNIPISSSFEIGQMVTGGNKGNLWNRAVNDPTFKRFMPQLQISLFNDIEKQALKGGKSAEEATAIAARAVKQFYGVTGSDKEILRGQFGKQLSGTFLFAPKFRESMVNFWKNNLTALKNPTALENRANIKFMAGSVLTFGAMDYLNYQLNGHHMWDNPKGKEDKLLIPTGDGTVIGIPFLSSIATVPRAIAREAGMAIKGDVVGAAADVGSSFFSSMIKPIFDVAKNSDYFGKDIVSENDSTPDKFKKIGGYLLTQYLSHPYIKETLDPRNTKDPMYQRISRALELPIRYYSQKSIASANYFEAKDEAYARLDKTQKAAFDAIPKQDPADPLAKQFKYITMLQYPQVYNAKKEIALKSDKNVDPLYTVNPEVARVYMLYEAQNPGSADRKALYKAHPEIGKLAQARSEYFAANPIPGDQASGGPPRPSARAQKLMDQGNFKDPEVKAFLDANTAYQNEQRSKLGLTQLPGYQQYAKKPKQLPKLKKVKLVFKGAKGVKTVKPKTVQVKQYRLKKATFANSRVKKVMRLS